MKQKQIKQIELSRGTESQPALLLAISKEIPCLSSKIIKIADFFDMDVQELDPRYLSVHSLHHFR